ncbi:MAG: molybdenum cofactor biosynthesis protein B, partial [Pseudohongiellaceae bacterium]
MPEALNIAVITVSDTRTEETDKSGKVLIDALTAAGHTLAARTIVRDDVYQLRAVVSACIADPGIEVILTTGGTGFTSRDNTFRALSPLLEVPIDGFGELFRQLSFKEIGSSTVQSRAFGGLTNKTVIFCLPGSPGACRTGWENIIAEQLNSDHHPCHFV